MPARYILRLDDVAPNMNWGAYHRLKDRLLATGVRPLLGVIPDNRDPELLTLPACTFDFWNELRSMQEIGWEIALHGFQHRYVTRDGGLLGRGHKSEFAGLGLTEQLDKLRRGKAILEGHGLRVRAFMAPSHSFDLVTLEALRQIDLCTVTDGVAVFPYVRKGILFVPQLLSGPRRMAFGVHTICIHLNTITDAKMARLLQFVADESDYFIAPGEAKEFRRGFPGNRILGGLIRRTIDARRRGLKAALAPGKW